MRLHISTDSGVPIYLQIVQQVKHLIASGRLNPGDELPSIRDLAQDLRVNPNTVARAYRELELAGVVTKRRTAGTYVSEAPAQIPKRERVKILSGKIDELLAEAHQMGIAVDEILDLIQQRRGEA